MPLQLLCLRGPLAGKAFPLGDAPLSFGRDSASTIKIANKLASRQHAEVRREAAGYMLYDWGSQNGTLVNGTRIATHVLRPGDEIVIGNEAFRVEELANDSTLPIGPQLLCLGGPLAGKAFPLGDAPLSFGRDSASTIKIASKLASRQHAEVRREAAGYILYDCGSQNGTFVNGARIATHMLRPGDEIVIGGEVFEFNVLALESDSTQVLPGDDAASSAAQSQPAHAPARPAWEPMQVTLEFNVQKSKVSIIWRCPFMGERITTFTPPYSEIALPLVIRALDAVQHPSYPHAGQQFTAEEQAALTSLGLWRDERVTRDANKIVGQALYTALGPDGQSALDTMRNYSIDQRRSISYVLRFPENGIRLAMLPWELLANHHWPLLIGRHAAVASCERYLNLPYAILPPLKEEQKPHLLAISPAYGIPDAVRREEREARLKTWNRLKEADQITFDEITPLTRRALSDYMRAAQRPPDIVHYFGHGIYRDGEGYLLFDDDDGGKSLVRASQLASLLGDVRLVMIHACQSAMLDQEDNLLTGVAPALSLVTGAVVGMQLTLRIAAATRFVEVFYDTLLAKRRSLQEAVAEGRQTLFFEEQDSISWFVPTLYIRSREQRPVYLIRDA